MITLAISHNVFISRRQRYDLFHGSEINVVGVHTPVWADDDITSEPAAEIFVEYKLRCRPGKAFIRQRKGWYEIEVPSIDDAAPPHPPDELWRLLTSAQQMKWHADNAPYPAAIDLLDVKDGGSEWLSFRQYQKLNDLKHIGQLHLIHFVEIKDIKDLRESIA